MLESPTTGTASTNMIQKRRRKLTHVITVTSVTTVASVRTVLHRGVARGLMPTMLMVGVVIMGSCSSSDRGSSSDHFVGRRERFSGCRELLRIRVKAEDASLAAQPIPLPPGNLGRDPLPPSRSSRPTVLGITGQTASFDSGVVADSCRRGGHGDRDAALLLLTRRGFSPQFIPQGGISVKAFRGA